MLWLQSAFAVALFQQAYAMLQHLFSSRVAFIFFVLMTGESNHAFSLFQHISKTFNGVKLCGSQFMCENDSLFSLTLMLLRLREGARCRPGWMQNRCLFRQSSEARLSEMHSTKSQGKRVVNHILNQNQESELQIKQTRARQNQNRYQRVVVYNFSIEWLTSNRHRIKINVLTGDRQTDWSI